MSVPPHRPLPDYAYVPGHGPHPTRDPAGHSYRRAWPPSEPLQLAGWRACAALSEGVRLFNHGYYWEAHEAWEQPFRTALDGTSERALCRGLIALAAAGVKVRQGLPAQVARFGARAAAHFRSAARSCAAGEVELDFEALAAFAEHVQARGPARQGDPGLPVQVVFEPVLRLGPVGEGCDE